MFKTGIIADCLRLPFRESIEKCAKLGADGVQLYAVSGLLDPETMTDDRLKEIKSVIKGSGLSVSALCGDLGGYGFSVEKDNDAKIEKSKKIIQLARLLDCNVVTTHIGVVPEDDTSKKYEVMLKACERLAGIAAANGAYFAIETGPEPAKRLKKFLDRLPRGIAVNLDPANLVMVTDDDPVEAVYTLEGYIVHTHVKDGVMLKKTDPKVIYDYFAEGGIGDLRLSDYFLETPLGEGKVDFDRYFAALKEIGYDGFLTIERETGADPADDIKRAMKFIKDKI